MSCVGCKYYDVSVDYCNADDICYMDGYEKGKAVAIDETLNKVTKRMSDYLEFDDVKIDWDLFCDEIKEIAKELKEQNK